MGVASSKTRNDLRRVRVAVVVPEGAQRGSASMFPPLDVLSAGAPPSSPPASMAQLLGARIDTFCDALSMAIGAVVVQAYGIRGYRELLDAIQQGEADLAWLPPVIALRAVESGAIPLAAPMRGGRSAFSSALFTRPDSPFRSIEEIAGARVAWVDRESAAGYLVSRASLRSRGLDLGRAFASEAFLGSHDAVVAAVLSGEADVGATFARVDPEQHRVIGSWGDRQVRVLDLMGPIPSDVVAASPLLPAPLRGAVQRALCEGMDGRLRSATSALMGAERFAFAEREHLTALRPLLGYFEDPE